jgi:hypothetical protein
VPVLGLEFSRGIVGETRVDRSVNGDIVVVVDQDQVVETPMSRKGDGWLLALSCIQAWRSLTFHTDTLLDTTITSHSPDFAIDNGETILVVLSSKLFTSYSQSDGIGDTLTKRTGGDFNTWELDLGVTSSHSMVDWSMVVPDLV